MGVIADIFKAYGDEYLAAYGDRIPAGHRKVINAIRTCRTIECGFNQYVCPSCHDSEQVYRGCGNRHCPNCQHTKNQQWLQQKLASQMPGHHFLITFTVPEGLRTFIRSNQRVAFDAMFQASSQALKAMAADEQFVGGDLAGFFGVLHTWGGQLSYHPHIHYVVPGGAYHRATGMWKPSASNFFVPVKALSKLFRGKLKDALSSAGLLEKIDSKVWSTDWIVNSQAVGQNAEGALKYLAPYVFRVAISDARIVRFENRQVTFRYRESTTKQAKIMTLDVLEFMRRFLQHVLPKGFMKIRYYGFMGPGCTVPPEEIAAMIQLALNFEVLQPDGPPWAPHRMTCKTCGVLMKLEITILPYEISRIAVSGYT